MRGFFDAGNVEAKTVVVEADGERGVHERREGGREGGWVGLRRASPAMGRSPGK